MERGGPGRHSQHHDRSDEHEQAFHETLPSGSFGYRYEPMGRTDLQERKAAGGMLVLGGGFAGSYVARLLGKRGATIVSRENFMLYTPILPEAASGTLEPRHVVVPLRQMCPHAELLLARVTAIDEQRHVATIERPDGGSEELRYEQLVVALGAVARSLPVPGLAEHAMGFKDLADAIHLRNHVLRELEAADAELDGAG